MLTLIYDQILSNYPLAGSKTALFVLYLLIFVLNCRLTLMSPFGVWVNPTSLSFQLLLVVLESRVFNGQGYTAMYKMVLPYV